jgi:hypothetical protein
VNVPITVIDVRATLHASYGDVTVESPSRVLWSGYMVTFEFLFIAKESGQAQSSTLHLGDMSIDLPCAATWGAGDRVTIVQPMSIYDLSGDRSEIIT